jgi:peptidoglycan/xylan/chitin deacetylase (PgdA/CDA1 family)
LTAETRPAHVGLTFDDGPSAWTGPILELLAAHGARATFFLIGRRIEERPELVRRIAEEGHEVGNHTWSHPSLATECDDEQVRIELERANAAIEAVLGSAPRLFRAPHYDTNLGVERVARSVGLAHVRGDIVPPDWHPRWNAKLTTTYVLQRLAPGAIIGLHDGIPPREAPTSETRAETVAAVRMLLPRLRDRGFACVPASAALEIQAPRVGSERLADPAVAGDAARDGSG